MSDEGPGVPEKVRATIFEPFFTTKTNRSGLGLAMARRYVEAHGGTLTAADNDPPPGATFVVWLPAGAKQ